jgi:HhH-GPD superfamily base excision DNA repair protein
VPAGCGRRARTWATPTRTGAAHRRALLFQVTGQQLSVPATRRTLGRIEALFGGRLPSAAELLETDPGKLREAGLSWRKISTLRDLAARLSDGRLSQDVLSSLPDDELIAELTAIPGIGPWTVQGAMIIALGREDVVLPGDLALRTPGSCSRPSCLMLVVLPAAASPRWRPRPARRSGRYGPRRSPGGPAHPGLPIARVAAGPARRSRR